MQKFLVPLVWRTQRLGRPGWRLLSANVERGGPQLRDNSTVGQTVEGEMKAVQGAITEDIRRARAAVLVAVPCW